MTRMFFSPAGIVKRSRLTNGNAAVKATETFGNHSMYIRLSAVLEGAIGTQRAFRDALYNDVNLKTAKLIRFELTLGESARIMAFFIC